MSSETWRDHFPARGSDRVDDWQPLIRYRALAGHVLAVARTRIEGTWRAYVDAVPGLQHRAEIAGVLETGTALDEPVARVLFPELNDIPYAQ
jgi:hypothetical protein